MFYLLFFRLNSIGCPRPRTCFEAGILRITFFRDKHWLLGNTLCNRELYYTSRARPVPPAGLRLRYQPLSQLSLGRCCSSVGGSALVTAVSVSKEKLVVSVGPPLRCVFEPAILPCAVLRVSGASSDFWGSSMYAAQDSTSTPCVHHDTHYHGLSLDLHCSTV